MYKTQLREHYENWLQARPEVFILFEKLANEARDAGFKKYSAWTLAQVIRWHFDIEQHGDFKLNNNYIALLARDLIEKDPSFVDFFQLRRTKRL